MNGVNPYPGSPYQQGGAGSQDSLSAQGYPSSDQTSSLAGQSGYYSAGYSGGQSDPFLNPPESQVLPYSGPLQQSYGQPYSQQHPYPQAPYGPYVPYGQSVYGGGVYEPRRHEGDMLGGWALGLGLASILMGCLYFGALLGVPAIILGVKGMRAADEGRATNKGISIAGVVLGSIGSAVSIFFILFLFLAYLGSQ